LSGSFDFANGSFDSTYASDGFSVSYACKINDYNTVKASIFVGYDDTYSLKYEIETILKESNKNTVTTTFGVENKSIPNMPIPEPEPVTVPVAVPEETELSFIDTLMIFIAFQQAHNQAKRQRFVDAVNDLGEAMAQSFEDFYKHMPFFLPFMIPVPAI